MPGRPIGAVLVTTYLALSGAVGLVFAGTLLLHGLTLEYINGFVVFGLILSVIIIVPAILSLVGAHRVWFRHPGATRVIKWAMGVRILLSIFPPGFIGPLGIGPFAVPLDAAVLVYAFTKKARNDLVGRPADRPTQA